MTPRFPWYDSIWLETYVKVCEWLQQNCPDRREEFAQTFDVLRTDSDFEIKEFREVLSPAVIKDLKQLCAARMPSSRDEFEYQAFGRDVIQGHPVLDQVQSSLVAMVSQAVGEEVEAHYNFLSLYSSLGRCSVHMDAPEAKWTLDCCIEQSEPWPIHFSQIQPWPEDFEWREDDWERQILEDSRNEFRSYTLTEGNGILFSGSSQWHYRDEIPQGRARPYCHLIFFHFIPAGTREILNPENWPEHFQIPELQPVVQRCMNGGK